MVIKKSYCPLISIFLIIVAMILVTSATNRQSSAADFYPDYPIGKPPILGGTGFVTEDHDGDGWYNEIDWGEQYTKKDNSGLYHKYHAGEDWNDERYGNTDVGAPVYAISAGTVIAIKDEIYANRNYGSGIVIEHKLPNGEKRYSVYVHIDIESGLSVGDPVWQGDRIGTIAAISPLSPHLHFEIRTKWVEPGQDWWPHDYLNTGYYSTLEDLRADGLIDPSDFIDSYRQEQQSSENSVVGKWAFHGESKCTANDNRITAENPSGWDSVIEFYNDGTFAESYESTGETYTGEWVQFGDTIRIQFNQMSGSDDDDGWRSTWQSERCTYEGTINGDIMRGTGSDLSHNNVIAPNPINSYSYDYSCLYRWSASRVDSVP